MNNLPVKLKISSWYIFFFFFCNIIQSRTETTLLPIAYSRQSFTVELKAIWDTCSTATLGILYMCTNAYMAHFGPC
uniref:Uncharacterized protein n=1 Tax=Anguilla anguilla TaxID=7936 RepID=A0A0E9XLY2_ANGAN